MPGSRDPHDSTMRIGIVGLGTMGRALAHNLLDHEVEVTGWNLEPDATALLAASRKEFLPATNLSALVASLGTPRVVLVMVPAGDAVDAIVDALVTHLGAEDIIIDAGNSHYEDTQRRATSMAAHGLHYVGLGVSGGEDGARHGPSMMFGGATSAAPSSVAPDPRQTVSAEEVLCGVGGFVSCSW